MQPTSAREAGTERYDAIVGRKILATLPPHRGRRPGHGDARAHRRGWPGAALELPAADASLENRPLAGRRLLHRGQAGQANHPERSARGRISLPGRNSSRCVQRGARQ